MTLKVWLIFFILSMAVNAEVLAWAVRSGQFTNINRGNGMPLRCQASPLLRPRRRWAILILLASLVVMFWAWGMGMVALAVECFGH